MKPNYSTPFSRVHCVIFFLAFISFPITLNGEKICSIPGFCSLQCPTGLDFLDSSSGAVECSGSGNCDGSTGKCRCLNGFSGANCAVIGCPHGCSGQGKCIDSKDMLASLGLTSTGNKGRGCSCNGGFTGLDCGVADPFSIFSLALESTCLQQDNTTAQTVFCMGDNTDSQTSNCIHVQRGYPTGVSTVQGSSAFSDRMKVLQQVLGSIDILEFQVHGDKIDVNLTKNLNVQVSWKLQGTINGVEGAAFLRNLGYDVLGRLWIELEGKIITVSGMSFLTFCKGMIVHDTRFVDYQSLYSTGLGLGLTSDSIREIIGEVVAGQTSSSVF